MWGDGDCVIKSACVALISTAKQVKRPSVSFPEENDLEIV
jgi:hypothetical protein